jgi:hypothetical protein
MKNTLAWERKGAIFRSVASGYGGIDVGRGGWGGSGHAEVPFPGPVAPAGCDRDIGVRGTLSGGTGGPQGEARHLPLHLTPFHSVHAESSFLLRKEI